MAKLCGVDLSEAVIPARQRGPDAGCTDASVIIAAHQNENDQPVFSIFVDHSLARYLWEAIEDAMGEWLE